MCSNEATGSELEPAAPQLVLVLDRGADPSERQRLSISVDGRSGTAHDILFPDKR